MIGKNVFGYDFNHRNHNPSLLEPADDESWDTLIGMF